MDYPNDTPDLLPPLSDCCAPSDTKTGLLPAFEPTSSPRLPRPNKRKHDGSPVHPRLELLQYPTPVPTSSTGIIPSSSPRCPVRPALHRTASTVSERVPLGDVRGLELNANGEPLLLGRSSNSSQYQLSANRLISRVHVKAAYHAPDDQHEKGRLIIECLGWNGMRIHCRGYTTDLGKGDRFESTQPHTEIMIGVQDARVLVRWPAIARRDAAPTLTDPAWDVDPLTRPTPPATPPPSSPPLMQTHLQSPVSPSPRARIQPMASSTFLGFASNPPSSPPAVQVYEDHESGEEPVTTPGQEDHRDQPGSATKASQTSSSLSPPENFSDHDEENDPIIFSFGPFGENLLPRMASFRAVSPERRKAPLRSSVSPRQLKLKESGLESSFGRAFMKSIPDIDLVPIRNHVVNQLAFSRLHSLPLSTIMSNLPSSLKVSRRESANTFSEEHLRSVLDDTACIGEIAREGKDAAGKALENEYYYVPEMDTDEGRRSAVEVGKPGIRAVRKQHKVR